MATNHFLPEDEAALLKQEAADRYEPLPQLDENNGLAPLFPGRTQGRPEEVVQRAQEPGQRRPYNLYQDGLKIYTTIDPRMQSYADEAVAKQMPILQKSAGCQESVRKRRSMGGSCQPAGKRLCTTVSDGRTAMNCISRQRPSAAASTYLSG